MQQITSLTDNPKQLHQLVLENNETAEFRLYFSARQESWYFDLVYKDLTINCLKVVISPNTIRNFKRLLPFGIAFLSNGDVEPFQLDDFTSGRVQMYVLNSEEVQQVEEGIYLVG